MELERNKEKTSEYVPRDEFEDFKREMTDNIRRTEENINQLSITVNTLVSTVDGYMKKTDEFITFLQKMVMEYRRDYRTDYRKLLGWTLGILGTGGMFGLLAYIIMHLT